MGPNRVQLASCQIIMSISLVISQGYWEQVFTMSDFDQSTFLEGWNEQSLDWSTRTPSRIIFRLQDIHQFSLWELEFNSEGITSENVASWMTFDRLIHSYPNTVGFYNLSITSGNIRLASMENSSLTYFYQGRTQSSGNRSYNIFTKEGLALDLNQYDPANGYSTTPLTTITIENTANIKIDINSAGTPYIQSIGFMRLSSGGIFQVEMQYFENCTDNDTISQTIKLGEIGNMMIKTFPLPTLLLYCVQLNFSATIGEYKIYFYSPAEEFVLAPDISVHAYFDAVTTEEPTTSDAVTTEEPTTSVSGTSVSTAEPMLQTTTLCVCECKQVTTNTYENMTKEEFDEAMEKEIAKIRKELYLDTSNLSSTVRKKISAPDERVPSKAAGYIACTILCLITGLVVIADVPILLQHSKMLLDTLKYSLIKK